MTSTGKVARVVVAALVTLAAVGSTAAPAIGAPDSWWRSAYGVDSLHAQGATGQGVKIAILDDQINPELSAFAGRDLSISEPAFCVGRPVTTTEAQTNSIHGTTLTALLIGTGSDSAGIQGIVPDAAVRFYGFGDKPAGEGCPRPEGYASAFSAAVERAVNDGAQIITTSSGWTTNDGDIEAVAYALARKVVIVVATANPGDGRADDPNDIAALNGVVSVAGADQNGYLQATESGQPFVVPFTTVVAPGADLPTLGQDGAWDESGSATGSSFAAPLVAGMLAMELQKYPGSTANQLIQALIRTTDGTSHEPAPSSEGLGYGTAVPASLLSVDPRSLPDENPLMEKTPGAGPTVQQITAAGERDTVVPPQRDSLDGLDVGQAETSTDVMAIVTTVVLVVLALVVVAGITTLVIVLARRRKKETT